MGRVVEGEVIGGRPDEPFAQRTRLGWVVFGPVTSASTSNLSSLTLSALLGEEEVRLEDLVRDFWKMEEVPAIEELHDDECGQIFETTHGRTTDGRYVVQLPLRRDAPELGDSYAYAARRFLLARTPPDCGSYSKGKIRELYEGICGTGSYGASGAATQS